MVHSPKNKDEALERQRNEKLTLLVNEVNKQLPTDINKSLRLVSLSVTNTQVTFRLVRNASSRVDLSQIEPEFYDSSKKLYCSELNFMQLIRNMSESSLFELTTTEKVLTQLAFTPDDCPLHHKD